MATRTGSGARSSCSRPSGCRSRTASRRPGPAVWPAGPRLGRPMSIFAKGLLQGQVALVTGGAAELARVSPAAWPSTAPRSRWSGASWTSSKRARSRSRERWRCAVSGRRRARLRGARGGVGRVVSTFGRLDILINSAAGTSWRGRQPVRQRLQERDRDRSRGTFTLRAPASSRWPCVAAAS